MSLQAQRPSLARRLSAFGIESDEPFVRLSTPLRRQAMHRIECILRNEPDPNEPEFFERFMRAVDTLSQKGFAFDLESEEEVDGALHLVWVERDELGELTLIKDQTSGISSVAVAVPKVADLKCIEEVLNQHLDIVPLSELLASSPNGLATQPNILLKIALIAVHQHIDPEVVSILQRGLEHRLPQLRYYAAFGIGVTTWPVFILDLERLLKLEPDVDVSTMAERALDVCRIAEKRASNGRR